MTEKKVEHDNHLRHNDESALQKLAVVIYVWHEVVHTRSAQTVSTFGRIISTFGKKRKKSTGRLQQRDKFEMNARRP